MVRHHAGSVATHCCCTLTANSVQLGVHAWYSPFVPGHPKRGSPSEFLGPFFPLGIPAVRSSTGVSPFAVLIPGQRSNASGSPNVSGVRDTSKRCSRAQPPTKLFPSSVASGGRVAPFAFYM
eukprot:3500523-Rhodomonas_salina.1